MRKIAALAAIAALCGLPGGTLAQSALDNYNYGVLYDPPALTTGTAWDYTVINAHMLDYLELQVANGTGASRTIKTECVNGSGTVTFAYPDVTVAASAKANIVMDPYVTTTTNNATGTTLWAARPCPRVKFSSVAAASTITPVISGESRGRR